MNRNLDYLEEVLKTVPAYVEAFRSVFGGEITRQRVAMAIAAFERTLLSRDTPLDRHLRGEPGALSARQRAGLELFLGKAGCATCHNGPNLTDERFHNLGVPEDPKAKEDPRVLATARFVGKVSGFPEYRTLREDPGRFLVTKDAGGLEGVRHAAAAGGGGDRPLHAQRRPRDPRGGDRLLRPRRRATIRRNRPCCGRSGCRGKKRRPFGSSSPRGFRGCRMRVPPRTVGRGHTFPQREDTPSLPPGSEPDVPPWQVCPLKAPAPHSNFYGRTIRCKNLSVAGGGGPPGLYGGKNPG